MNDKFEEIVKSIDKISQKEAIDRLNNFLAENVSFVIKNSPVKRKVVGKILPALKDQYIGGYPTQYLFFDFCLAALQGDYVDARLHLENASYVLEIDRDLFHFLSTIIEKEQCKNPEVSKLLTLFALAVEPISASSHAERLGKGYAERFAIYEKKIEELRPK
ncbi:MAG: hypothetical protein KGI19_08360 [Thaumarchaeota archaeon]|nr:hypothetical protein [Nitrososphaerota archaeon]